MITNFHQVLAQCPICLNEETMTIWDQIDASTDPDLREKLLHKTLQSLECRNCGNSTLIASPLTYFDPNLDLLVECHPDLDREQLLQRLTELQKADIAPVGSNPDDCRASFCRLAATTNDLIEKIHAREQHLDDRALEIVKLAVINHGAGEVSVEDLRFVGISANELNFVMKLEDGWFQYALPLEAYTNAERIVEQLGATTKAADSGFILVDRQYAEEMLAAFTGAMSDPEAP
jgi:hypothetical protein